MSSSESRQDLLVRSMPAVFVLIWSTGFIVARYGMPYAPPLKFLAVRYALSVLQISTKTAGIARTQPDDAGTAAIVIWPGPGSPEWPSGGSRSSTRP